MKTKSLPFNIGAYVVFHSKYGVSARNGQKAKVVLHGNGEDESGIAHAIEFVDGHQLCAYPQELNLM